LIVLDTSILVALLDSRDAEHAGVVAWYETLDDDLVTTPLVLAEVDHLVLTRGGPATATAFHADIRSGAYAVEWWDGAATAVADIADAYADFPLGLTDASLVAVAARIGTTRIATLDHRHFRTVKAVGGDAFTVLPADA